MKNLTKIVMMGAIALSFASCAALSTPVGTGILYTDVVAGEGVTSNSLGSKTGQASASNVLGLVATGDASIQQAAKAGGIKKISHIDSQKKSILGLYSTYTVTVYGE